MSIRLPGMGLQFSPVSSALVAPEENAKKVHDTLRETMREQGELTSLTLQNNAMLWEERKTLRAQLSEARAEKHNLQLIVSDLKAELAKLQTPEHRNLHELRIRLDAAEQQVAGLKRALTLHLTEAIDPSEIKPRMAAIQKQHDDLLADGLELPKTPEALPDTLFEVPKEDAEPITERGT